MWAKNLVIMYVLLNTSFGCRSITTIESEAVYQTRSLGFAQAVGFNGLLFTSGMVAWNSNHELEKTGFEEQVKATFKNLNQLLQSQGISMNELLLLRFYVVDLDGEKRKAVSEELRRNFTNGYQPCTTLLGVAALAQSQLKIEIEAVAKHK